MGTKSLWAVLKYRAVLLLPYCSMEHPEGKKDYTLCICRSYDCKEQTWQAKDGQIKDNCPPQARAKLEAKLVVTFVPSSSDFFSQRGDNALSVKDLTAKYGAQVFADYDLDYEKVKSTKAGSAANATSDNDDGDSIGSQDCDDEHSLGDQESMGSFLSESDGGKDDDAEFADEGQDTGGQGEQMASDDEEGHRAAFAAEFDIPMNLETEIFGGSGDESI
ncbi:hypothetical protein C8R44DRAFT_742710 [Mycena epipterygia]|nr:hypothetical protein C8R44DRAFT_742710 [Mycena epipterygia]